MIQPSFRPIAVVAGRRPVKLLSLTIADLSPAATVVIQSRSVRERLTANSGGKVTSKRFRKKTMRVGTVFTIKITKAGYIGYWAKLRLQNRLPILRRVGTRLCIPAVGTTAPRPCGTVDRGK